MSKPVTQKQFVINNLRRSSYRWGPRNACKQKAKIGRNQYKCSKCNLIYGNKDVRVDHINPVVDPVAGFIDWNTYISRLLCDENGYQLLCNPCHDNKTDGERVIRKLFKDSKKLVDKKRKRR